MTSAFIHDLQAFPFRSLIYLKHCIWLFPAFFKFLQLVCANSLDALRVIKIENLVAFSRTKRFIMAAAAAVVPAWDLGTPRATQGLQKMFSPRSPAMAQVWNARIQDPPAPAPALPPNQVLIPPPYPLSNLLPLTPLTRADLRRMLATNAVGGWANGISPRAAENYLHIICEYVNARHQPPRTNPGDVPICAYMDLNFYNNIGVAGIYRNHVSQASWYRTASLALTAAGYGPATFLKMKHLFIPVHCNRVGPPAARTTLLVVISPLSKSIDILDSNPGNADAQLLGDFLGLIATHLERRPGQPPRFDVSEWRQRTNAAFKQPLANVNDAAIHVCANAMSVAFGYSLNRVGLNINDRRRRMASELVHGSFLLQPWTQQDYTYPIITRNSDYYRRANNGSGTHWLAYRNGMLKTHIVNDLPDAPRARFYTTPRRRYQHGVYHGDTQRNMTDKASLKAYCRSFHNRYNPWPPHAGHAHWCRVGQNDHDVREQMEIRDMLIAENGFGGMTN